MNHFTASDLRPHQTRGDDRGQPGGRESRGQHPLSGPPADPGPQHQQPPGEGEGHCHGWRHQGQQGRRCPHTNQVAIHSSTPSVIVWGSENESLGFN